MTSKNFPITNPENLSGEAIGLGQPELSEIDTGIIPFVIGGIETRMRSNMWASSADYNTIGLAIRKYEVALLMGIGTDIANAIDRLYTLNEAAQFGIMRESLGANPITGRIAYNPPIPDTPNVINPRNTNEIAAKLLSAISGSDNPYVQPSDNLLTALRGAVESGANRNVIDALGQGLSTEEQQELFSELLKLVAFLMA
jgi:hypothetical protein